MIQCTFFRRAYRRSSATFKSYKDSQTAARMCSGILTGYYGIASAHYLSDYIGDLADFNSHEQTAADLGIGMLGFVVGYVLGSFACQVAGKVAGATPLSRIMPGSAPLLMADAKKSSDENLSEMNARLNSLGQSVSAIEKMMTGLVGMRFTANEMLRQEFEAFKREHSISGDSRSSDDCLTSQRYLPTPPV